MNKENENIYNEPEEKPGKRKKMHFPLGATIVMGALALVLFIIAAQKGDGSHLRGLKITGNMALTVLPMLAFAFLAAGFIMVLVPKELVSRWLGEGSGFKGIMIGTLAGTLTPGGPYVVFPLMLGFWKAGAGMGTLVAYATAWSLLGVGRLPYEIGILDWRFALARTACVFFFPPLAGLLAHVVFRKLQAP